MTNFTEEQQLVYSMLTENTGSHFLDSGGAYGRHHQRNAKKTIEDFNREEAESYEFDYKNGEIVRTVSVFHFLSHSTELDELCNEFNKRNTAPKNWEADADVYGVSTEAWDYLQEATGYDVKIDRTWNTYNGESDLSQVLQGSNLEIDGELYFLIQVHGGCDVRGGYTDAKLFKAGYFCEGIHEYIWEYKDSYEIEQDVEEEYISEMGDYWNADKVFTIKEVKARLEELKQAKEEA